MLAQRMNPESMQHLLASRCLTCTAPVEKISWAWCQACREKARAKYSQCVRTNASRPVEITDVCEGPFEGARTTPTPGRKRANSCGRGHAYTERNSYVDSRGRQHCRRCDALRARAKRRKGHRV